MRVLDEILEAQRSQERPMVPTPAQRRAVRKDLQAFSHFVFGSDWAICKEKFCQQNGIRKFKKRRLDVWARRCGKTETKAIDVTVVLVAFPELKIHTRYYSQSLATCQVCVL
jgi:hypothetical protein